MQRPPSVAGRRVVVMGLGRFGGGVGVTRWLVSQGAVVTVSDVADAETLRESIDALADVPVTLHLGGHDLRDLDAADLVVVNPAVRKDRSDFFQEVLRRGCPWTTELNLFCESVTRLKAPKPPPVIGITGTYGKSTTAAMLAHVLQECCHDDGVSHAGVHLGGNIGRSLLPDLPRIRSTDVVVLEISSAQLEDLPRIDWTPDVAVITTLSPHHLDRYGTYLDYVRTKLNIIGSGSTHACGPALIVGALDAEAQAALQHMLVSRQSEIEVTRVTIPDPPVALRVPGKHNQANAACALAVCSRLGLSDARARAALGTFPGLPHRLEWVRSVDGLDFYNDSKSTSPATIATSLHAFERPIVAIVGGQNVSVADDAWRTCGEALSARCRAVVCTGESGPRIARYLLARASDRFRGSVVEAPCLKEAVAVAIRLAEREDAVLFSPGAPSFDAYANFTARGQHFIEVVNRLKPGVRRALPATSAQAAEGEMRQGGQENGERSMSNAE